ncbi:hypothetical protein PO878_03930 [Iamia majanohamensis]|uniref:Uncharacterized protein n=1 Tax=Iamia majanohamensis TaxID=467976 RepID=A0AAE9Y7A7_9ACTN|nr:hypothetical protein [Iamia majanohamensis]WCO67872.1 hypothetical protein PO878_03930 [Iamia majanohamensis]
MTVTVDGDEHPILYGEITARQVAEVRQLFGMSPRAFPRLIKEKMIDLPEVAAMVYLSHLQRGEPVDIDTLLDQITFDSEVRVDAPEAVDADAVPDADPNG